MNDEQKKLETKIKFKKRKKVKQPQLNICV